MKTLTNILKTLSLLTVGLYMLGSASLIGWLAFQAEPSMIPTPMVVMVVGGEVHEMGQADVFCEGGIAWYETHTLGVNLPVTDQGDLITCEYAHGTARWAVTAFDHLEVDPEI